LNPHKFSVAVIALGLVCTALVGGCVNREAQKAAVQTGKILSDPDTTVETVDATSRDLADTVEITGQLVTGTDTQVGAKNSGRLLQVFVDDGSKVNAGDIIAVQDTNSLQAQLAQAFAQVQAAQAQLAQQQTSARLNPARSSAAVSLAQASLGQAKASLEKARQGARPQERAQADANLASAKSNLDTQQKELARLKTLAKEGAIAANRVDAQQNLVASAQAAYDSSKQTVSLLKEGTRREDIRAFEEGVHQAEESVRSARANQALDVLSKDLVAAARASVASAAANVRLIQQQIQDATIRAPYAGTISGKPAQTGTVLGPGGVVAQLVGNSNSYFEGQVPEQVVETVKVGSQVQVTIDAIKKTITGTVTSLNPLGTSFGRSFSVRIVLAGLPADAKPGMFARGVITLRTIPDAILIPVTAVVTRNEKRVVFVVEDGKAKSIPVTQGLRDAGNVQVTGIAVGQKVVVRGQESLDDGSKVKVDDGKAADAATEGEKKP